jgi:ADP-ribose pyrophosphatase YjhB (NUDIX family)
MRPVCPSCGKVHFIDPKVGAGVLISRADKVLLVRRAVEPEKGKWTLPAGFVEGDEDPAATAVRECFEETGLQIEITGLLDVIHGKEHGSGASIVIMYEGKILGGTLEARDDADAVDFYDPNKLPPLGFEATRRAIHRWKAISAQDSAA